MKLAVIVIVSLVALGCAKGGAPKANVKSCDDVEAHGLKLYAQVTPRGPAAVGRDLFAQEGVPAEVPVVEQITRLEAEAWRVDCEGNAWTQAEIDCYVAAPTADDAAACVSARTRTD